MQEQPSPQLPPRGMPTWGKGLIALGVAAVLALLITGGLILPRLRAKQDEGQRNLCMNNLRNIGMALQSFRNVHGAFPPAYIADADGKPMHSWRVLILPYLQEQALYDQYDFDEPWNGPNNSKLASKLDFLIFTCPSNKQDQHAHFLAVVGPETIWPGSKGGNPDLVRDMPGDTLLLVEATDTGIHWMEPRDMTFEDALQGINANTKRPHISTRHREGASVLWCDNRVTTLPTDLSKESLKAILTANGGEVVEIPYD